MVYLGKSDRVAAFLVPLQDRELVQGRGRVDPDSGIPTRCREDLPVGTDAQTLLAGMFGLDDLERLRVAGGAVPWGERMLPDDCICRRREVRGPRWQDVQRED